MNGAKINASILNQKTHIQIEGNVLDIGTLLMQIIQKIVDANDGIAFASITGGIETSSKEKVMYENIMRNIQNRRGNHDD